MVAMISLVVYPVYRTAAAKVAPMAGKLAPAAARRPKTDLGYARASAFSSVLSRSRSSSRSATAWA
jgi:hypothetical protein